MPCGVLKRCKPILKTRYAWPSDELLYSVLCSRYVCEVCWSNSTICKICDYDTSGYVLKHFHGNHKNDRSESYTVFNNNYIRASVRNKTILIYSLDVIRYVPCFPYSYCESEYGSLVGKIYSDTDIHSIIRDNETIHSLIDGFDDLMSLLKEQKYFCMLCDGEYETIPSMEVMIAHLNKCVIQCRQQRSIP